MSPDLLAHGCSATSGSSSADVTTDDQPSWLLKHPQQSLRLPAPPCPLSNGPSSPLKLSPHSEHLKLPEETRGAPPRPRPLLNLARGLFRSWSPAPRGGPCHSQPTHIPPPSSPFNPHSSSSSPPCLFRPQGKRGVGARFAWTRVK